MKQQIYQNIKNFRQESKFSTWLYRVTVNTVWDYLRKQKHRKTIPIEKAAPVYIKTDMGSNELKDLLNIQIQKLPVKYRTVLILKEIDKLQFNQISEILGENENTVKGWVCKARRYLSKILLDTNPSLVTDYMKLKMS